MEGGERLPRIPYLTQNVSDIHICADKLTKMERQARSRTDKFVEHMGQTAVIFRTSYKDVARILNGEKYSFLVEMGLFITQERQNYIGKII